MGSGNGTRDGTRKYELVLSLYAMGYSVEEIAERVYGCREYRCRQRVRSIIYLYGKRLGLLDAYMKTIYSRSGEYVSRNGLVIEHEVDNTYFYEFSVPTPPQVMLGGYSNIRQLKASLTKDELCQYKIIEWVGRFASVLGLRRESPIKMDAYVIAKHNVELTGKYPYRVIAAASLIVALIFHGYNIKDFLDIVNEYGIQRDDLIHVLRELKLPREVSRHLAVRFVMSMIS